MKMSNKIKRWPPLRYHFLDWNLDTKLTPCFHPPVVNTERETNVRYASKFFACERYSIFRDAHLLSHFAGEIKSAISKVESLATGSDSFSVLVKLIEEEASVI